MYPLIIVSGAAGSGKDTFAQMLCEGRGGVMIAQADPMKRFAQQVFGFTDEQLWGPSEMRNGIDPRFTKEEAWDEAYYRALGRGNRLAKNWLAELECYPIDVNVPVLGLWFQSLREKYSQTGLSPRACLQLLGTEFGRKIDQNVWSRYAIRTAEALLVPGNVYDRKAAYSVREDLTHPGASFVVITDGRFRNEILNVKKTGGMAVQISNPTPKAVEGGVAGHASEAEMSGIPKSWFDMQVLNDKSEGLEGLKKLVDGLWEMDMFR